MKPPELRAVAGARKRAAPTPALTIKEILALPASVDVPTAARCFNISESKARELARRGEFPCPVLKVDRKWKVPTAGILRALGIGEASDAI